MPFARSDKTNLLIYIFTQIFSIPINGSMNKIQRLPNLSELTPTNFNMKLIHLVS